METFRRSEGAEEDVGVGVAVGWVEEGVGEAADGLEAEALPEAQGAVVGVDHEVELDGAVAAGFGVVERVQAHGASDSLAGEGCGGDVAAVGDMRTAALLIGAKVIGADDLVVAVGDEDFMGGSEPIGQGGFTGHVARQGVGVSSADDRFDDGPDGVGIARAGGADGEQWVDHTEFAVRMRFFVRGYGVVILLGSIVAGLVGKVSRDCGGFAFEWWEGSEIRSRVSNLAALTRDSLLRSE